MFAVGTASPAVRAELQAEQDDAAARPCRSQVAAGQHQAVFGRKTNLFRFRQRLAARDDQKRLFLENAHHMVLVFPAHVHLLDHEGEACEKQRAAVAAAALEVRQNAPW